MHMVQHSCRKMGFFQSNHRGRVNTEKGLYVSVYSCQIFFIGWAYTFFIVYVIVKMLCILMEINKQHLQMTAIPEVDIY